MSKPPKTDYTSADAAFARLFRVQLPLPEDAYSSLDRLTVLACMRQGIAPHELLPGAADASLSRARTRSPATPHSPKSPESVARIDASKADVANKRRLAKIDIVELERRSIVDVIFRSQQDKQRAQGKLSHEAAQLQSELWQAQRAAPGASTGEPRELANNPAEAAAVRELLGHVHDLNPQREKLLHTIEETKRHGEEEIEKMRKRQLRFVMNDVQREVEKQEIQAAIAEKERKFAAAEQERQSAVEAQAAARAKAHRKKLTALRIRNEVLYQHKKDELEHRERQQHSVFVRTMQEKAARLAEMRMESERKSQLGREKAAAVREQDALRCELLQRELETADELHEHRREHLQLHLHVRREQRRVAAMRKHVQSQRNVAAIDDGTEAARKRLDERDAAATQNIHERVEDREARLRELASAEAEANRRAEERRQQLQRQRERRNVELLTGEVEHEQHIALVRAEQEEARLLRSQLNEQRHAHHIDNIERLKRLNEYRQEMRDRVLREARERDRANRAMKFEMSTKLQMARQQLVQNREHVNEQIMRMRNSPRFRRLSPQAMLMETMASIARTGERQRAASASSRAGRSPDTADTAAPSGDANRSSAQKDNRPGTTPSREVAKAVTPCAA